MKKIFVDTDVVIDLLAKRQPFYDDAARLFSLADKGKIEINVSSLTFANTNYILSKILTSSKSREILLKFKILVEVLPLNEKIIDLSLSDKSFSDFEDGLQHYSALENNSKVIITRNLRHFKNSKLPVNTPKEFMAI